MLSYIWEKVSSVRSISLRWLTRSSSAAKKSYLSIERRSGCSRICRPRGALVKDRLVDRKVPGVNALHVKRQIGKQTARTWQACEMTGKQNSGQIARKTVRQSRNNKTVLGTSSRTAKQSCKQPDNKTVLGTRSRSVKRSCRLSYNKAVLDTSNRTVKQSCRLSDNKTIFDTRIRTVNSLTGCQITRVLETSSRTIKKVLQAVR